MDQEVLASIQGKAHLRAGTFYPLPASNGDFREAAMAGPMKMLADDRTMEREIGAIMQTYNRRLFRVAVSILGDEAAAEDAVQETYIQCFRKRDSFRGESELGTWLTRVLINQALMQKRRRRSTLPLDDFAPAADILLHPSLVSSEDPEKLAARREMKVLIERALAELPESFRLAFILREVEGLSSEEAATALGIAPQTLRTRVHRAKRRLRAALDSEFNSVLAESFPFAGARCAALVDRVLSILKAEWAASVSQGLGDPPVASA